ncbi:uncharacterized protein Tco025E_09615 [Trypanosoma conorhini]|uniref:Uncharacterized protein n=1 Tax=Trypanosoma conorhini TaxID=83891 RepID=A0A422MUM0_9TRYP|nr:uncharacterized protein Tco025E_09615 [Trypanosoma conorhini]RNE96890.1 hypothetical protein Tco025E_09615 [Trypanosoma conorhini]
MIYPKLLASQELSLRRITVQQHGFATQLLGQDANGVSASANSANASVSSLSLPRQASVRSELTSPLTLSSGGQVGASFSPNKTAASSLAPITGCGTNSTAPASIARPKIRVRSEWGLALQDLEPFVLPERQLHGSQPSTRRRVTVRYVADQYDRQWIAQRQASSNPVMTKGKTGGIGHPAAASPSSVSSSESASASAARQKISLSLLEDLITAFEVGSYSNPEIPVQRQPVSSFTSVIATGADASVVEEVRQYWLGKRQALGGNVPCIPSLHMNVEEDNQMSLCHSELLQLCPLPFNHRDWSVAVLQRRIPQSMDVKKTTETDTAGVKSEETLLSGRKRRRSDTDKVASGEAMRTAATAEEDAAEWKERHALLSSGLKVARAVLEREELKLAHTHLALYELALLRQAAKEGRDSLEGGGASLPVHTPWASDEALKEDWEGDEDRDTGSYDGVGSGFLPAAVESVMAVDRGLC